MFGIDKDMDFEVAYKDSFTVAEFYDLTDKIANGYFDENGEYTPQVGDAIAMMLFFNVCVTDKEQFTDKEVLDNLTECDDVFENEDFIQAFNEAIFFNGQIRFDFANAFKNAMEIVTYRTDSPVYAVKKVEDAVKSVIDIINNTFDEDRLERLNTIAENVSSSEFNAKAVSDAFAETEAFQKILELEPKQEGE